MPDTTIASSIASTPARQISTTPDKSPAGVARQFEAVFAGQVAKIMMETVEVDDQFGGGHGEEMFRGMMAEQIGNKIAQGKGLGIASAVEAQIIRMQGGVVAAPAGTGAAQASIQQDSVQSGATQAAAALAASEQGDTGSAE